VALVACLRKTRAPATKPTRREMRMAMIMGGVIRK